MNRIEKRIRDLLALAEHPNTPAAEAATAARQAERLMIKHHVSRVLLDAGKPAELAPAVQQFHYVVAGSHCRERARYLLGSICEPFSVKVTSQITNTRRADGVWVNRASVFGVKEDWQAAQRLFEYLDIEAAHGAVKWSASARGFKSYLIGFAWEVSSRLGSLIADDERAGTGTDLVLANRLAHAEKAMISAVPGLARGRRPRALDHDAYLSGLDDGATVSLVLPRTKVATGPTARPCPTSASA